MIYNSHKITYKNCPILESEIKYLDSIDFSAFENFDSAFIVTDNNVSKLPSVKSFLKDSQFPNIILEAGERFKTVENILNIIKKALDNNINRNSVFIGIGGGVICDMTAFASSIFKRGSKLCLVPTTLLAMVDASIGGKTGCDFSSYKNMIGSFYPASEIYIMSDFAKTLPEKEYFSGLGEVVKTAMLYDKDLLELLENDFCKIKNRDSFIIQKMIEKCSKAKATVVEKDLHEKNIRMYLNLGHTFGHALESIAGLGALTHGEAVAWGISRAIALSEKLGFCSSEYKKRIFTLLEKYDYCTKPIHPVFSEKNSDDIIENMIITMKKDKKNETDKIRFVLQKDLTDTFVMEIESSKIEEILK